MSWRTCRGRTCFTESWFGVYDSRHCGSCIRRSQPANFSRLLQALYVLGNSLRLVGGNAIDGLRMGSFLASRPVLNEISDVNFCALHGWTDLASAFRTMAGCALCFVDGRAIFGGPGK